MDTKKLRQKILDLAIHGKLVPQDPNDEPASVLLERIRAEKERLITEGKIKRSKKAATSDTSHYENVPFEVPKGWCWCRLEEVLSKLTDGSHNPPPNSGEGYPVISAMNIKNGEIDLSNVIRYVSEADYNIENARTQIKKGDIILGIIGGSIGNLAFYNHEDKVIAQRSIAIMTSIINSRYAYYVLKSNLFQKEFLEYANGSAQGGVYLGALSNMLFPLPPQTEQIRIVEEVEKWKYCIDQIECGSNNIVQSINIAKSKILDLAIHGKLVPQDFNDEPASELLKRINPKAIASCDNPQYGKVPSSWVITTVGEVFTINPKTHVEDNIEAAFVPMTCVADGYSNTFEYECRKWGDIKKGFVHFQENDVAVAKISPCLENRKSVVFHDLPNGIGAGTTELNVFRCEEILPEYALFYFKSQMFIGSCAGTYNGVVGQQRVAKSFIQELPIGIPPYKEQLRIVSKVNDLFSQLDMIEKSLQA